MNIGIVGLGLMGGSFGRTLVKRTEHKVFGADISLGVMEKGEMLNAYHTPLTPRNAGELDMLIISVYPQHFKSVIDSYLPYLKSGAIVIDFCGIKRPVVEQMKACQNTRQDIIYIGGHPMAGREFSGIEKSVTTLFDKASMILVNVNADIFVLQEVKQFFLNLGFQQVVITTADNHDEMIAFTSQLCHIVSNAFIKNKTAENHTGYSAGSYKDLTRVARLNPNMWTELMMQNKDKLSKELNELIQNLTKYQNALDNSDSNQLYELLKEGNDIKLSIDLRSK